MTGAEIRAALAKATTIAECLELRAAAVALGIAGADADDIVNFRLGLQLKITCERHGGALLLQMLKHCAKLPVTRLGVAHCSQFWRELAALDSADFEKKIARLAVRNLPSQVQAKRREPVSTPVVTRLTDWTIGADGVKTRCLIAEGVTPPLRGERATLET